MHYVKHFDINGIDTRQVACIELHGSPNAATVGAVGLLGMNVDSPSHEIYKCVAVNGSIYTWELLVEDGVGITNITSVTEYGAKGDGTTDDTAAFQNALNENRVVYVPGGTYKLTSGIVIGDNCCLEFAQDAVLNFTNTSGNCITLGMVSTLKGNHATVNVPYAFNGNVLYANSTDHTNDERNTVEPWSRWSPQWKSGRYVTDLNICKEDNRGFHYAVNPEDCKGTAVYLFADGNASLTFMWGIHYSGLRIAGAFAYGIRAVNTNEGWLHDMRIDAFIDACETGVSLEDCNNAYISAIIQPRRALKADGTTYVPYAKHGIKLIRSKHADLSGSRVWDWNAERSLYGTNPEYKFISMYGECRGAIINAVEYYDSGHDVRDLIYTDTASNLEQITILQEPITRWFKPVDNEPYFFDGYSEKKLVTKKELDEHFITDEVAQFVNQLPIATDTDGTVYNGVGYKNAHISVAATPVITAHSNYRTTGFIPCKQGSKVYTEDFNWNSADGYCRILFFDANRQPIVLSGYTVAAPASNIVANTNPWQGELTKNYAETDNNGFVLTIGSASAIKNVAYVRFCIRDVGLGTNPAIAVDEEIKYTVEGFLADGVKVKSGNIIGNVDGKGSFYVDISTGNGYSCSTKISTLDALLDTGCSIVAKITTDTGALFAPLCSYETSADNSYGRIVMFALGMVTFTLTPTSSDSYEVTVSGD
jgi:hypothetical protein